MANLLKVKRRKSKRDPNQLDISGHTKELKRRLLVSVLTFIILFGVCLYYCPYLMDFIIQVGRDSGYEFIYIAPQEVLIQQIKVAGVFALVGAIPVILFEITRFIAPAFEFRFASLKLIFTEFMGLCMFALGVLFTYKILFPFTCLYLYGVGMDSNVVAQISIEKYVSLFLSTTTCMGIVFEIPLISVILTKLGLITADLMKKCRSVIIILIFVIAALITPPDVISQLIVAIPMVCLYQVSIFLCAIFGRKKAKEQDETC